MEDAQTQESQEIEEQQSFEDSFRSQEIDDLVDEQIEERITDVQDEREARRRRMEYIKFGILAAILLGTVLVLWIAQPLVFGRIVPAVMGDGQTTTDADTSLPEAAPTTAPDSGAPTAVPPATDQNTEQGEGVPENTDSAVDENMDTAVEQPTAVTGQIYVVQSGDTLNSIARQFNTSVEAITAVNDIPNPDSLMVGTPLTIPQP